MINGTDPISNAYGHFNMSYRRVSISSDIRPCLYIQAMISMAMTVSWVLYDDRRI